LLSFYQDDILLFLLRLVNILWCREINPPPPPAAVVVDPAVEVAKPHIGIPMEEFQPLDRKMPCRGGDNPGIANRK
jgi:hypothetical protein